jgi:hypothetical protein
LTAGQSRFTTRAVVESNDCPAVKGHPVADVPDWDGIDLIAVLRLENAVLEKIGSPNRLVPLAGQPEAGERGECLFAAADGQGLETAASLGLLYLRASTPLRPPPE